jgi:hypothetical protein
MSIKNRIKLSVGGIWLVMHGYAFAWPFDGKLDIYKCTSSVGANACDDSCKKMNDAKVKFKVDGKQKAVLASYYKNGNQVSSSIFDGCQIFNDENWVCSNGDKTVGIIAEQKMVNGVFTDTFTMLPLNPRAKIESSSSCAK